MRLTRVDLYNLALGKVKIAKRVREVTDQTVERYMLPQVYDLVLAQMLERHPWGFATKTDKLAKTAESDISILPNSVYLHRWVYPHDCHKILVVGHYADISGADGRALFRFSRHFPWEVVLGQANDRVIGTQHDHACIRYLSNDVPEAMWPASFVQAVTWAMASEITRSENASDSDADYRMAQAQAAFEAAKRADAQEDGGGFNVPGDWVLSRGFYSDVMHPHVIGFHWSD